MINFKDKQIKKFLLDGKFRLVPAFGGGGTFIHADGHEACVNVSGITNLDNVYFDFRLHNMTKAQLLEKGVLYHPDGLPDNHFEVRYIRNIPIDLREDEVVWCPMSVLFVPWFKNRYEVDRDLFEKQKGGIKVDGKTRFYRIPMKLKANSSDL